MSSSIDSMLDITNRYIDYSKNVADSDTTTIRTLEQLQAAQKAKEESKDKSTLSFEDMLLLMVTQLQNQTIDNQADTNDMMNQIIQMTVMQALTEVSTQVDQLTEANILNYSASLVGKEVTVGVYNEKTETIDEIYGTVTASGTYNGQQVLFIGDEYYPLSSIMAVGKLPEKKVPIDPMNPDDKVDENKKPEETEGGEQVDETDPNKPVEETGGNQESSSENTDSSETDVADKSGTVPSV